MHILSLNLCCRIHIDNRKLRLEEARATMLLETMLPRCIVPRLRNRDGHHGPIADSFSDVTILWTDIKGFTKYASTRSPMEVFTFLNALSSTFDRIVERYGASCDKHPTCCRVRTSSAFV